MTPELVWGLFARALAITYVVALISLRAQILGLCGARGISPLRQKLVHIRAELGPWRALARHPTLFWLSSSDLALRAVPLAGVVCATLAAIGVASPVMLAAAWVVYLSLDTAIGMTFPWESMLYEAGLLAVLLPTLVLLPDLRMTEAPGPPLLLAFLWLLFRVIFGFGKNKFTREAIGDPVYLRGFLISQPLVSPLGWRAFRLPRIVLVAGLMALFVVEMVLPFFIFVPGWPRWVAAVAFCGLMIAIQAMGSFGFFNLLVAVLCVPLFDPRSIAWPVIDPSAGLREVVTSAVVGWALVGGLLHLPFNTWVARGWPEWPAWAALPRGLAFIVSVLRHAMPFRSVHAYGVFPPHIGPPLKWIPVIEGTRDGREWSVFEYRSMPSTEWSPPQFVAPHTPRLDHFALYEGCGVGAGNYLGTIFSQGNPYDFSTRSQMDRLLQRLMEPGGPVRDLFGAVPFDGAPPTRMRIRLYAFTPTTPAERAETGRYWHKDLVGEHAAERGPDDEMWTHWLPAGEQLHPDERWARRRVPRMAPLLAARRLDPIRRTLDGEANSKWEEFWDQWIPCAREACRAGWPAVIRHADRLRASMPSSDIDALDRIRGAVTTALLERIEPHVLAVEKPMLDVASYFHASLLVHAVTLRGHEGTDAVLQDPLPLIQAPDPDFETQGLRLLTLLRPDMMELHARKQRMLATMLLPPPPPTKALPGFSRVMPPLAAALPDADERLPVLDRTVAGEWRINGVLFTERRLDG